MTDTSDESLAMTGEPDDPLLVRYLMGACSEDEKARVDAQLFARDDVFERLCALEEELVGRRLRGELTAEDRDRFDRAYAAPPRRDRVLFARALKTVLSEEDAVRQVSWWSALWGTSGFRLALAAASIVLVAGVALLTWRANELRSSLEGVQAENDTLRRQREGDRQRLAELEQRAATLSDELSRERSARPAPGDPKPSPGLVATFVLSPGLLRSARAPARLLVRPATEHVRLQLDLEPGIDAARFRAELHNAAARVLWSQDGLRPTPLDGGAAIVVTIPAALFDAGEYEVVVHEVAGRQVEEAGRYYFELVKR